MKKVSFHNIHISYQLQNLPNSTNVIQMDIECIIICFLRSTLFFAMEINGQKLSFLKHLGRLFNLEKLYRNTHNFYKQQFPHVLSPCWNLRKCKTQSIGFLLRKVIIPQEPAYSLFHAKMFISYTRYLNAVKFHFKQILLTYVCIKTFKAVNIMLSDVFASINIL